MPTDSGRRSLMKYGLQLALISVPVVMAAKSRKALAEDEADGTRAKFHYQEHPNGGMSCAQCVFYVPSEPNGPLGVCRIIDGNVTANSWCTAFRKA